jgi:integral membrane protein
MTSTFDRRRAGAERPGNDDRVPESAPSGSRFGGVAGWFRLVALAEAVSWVGLLTGMYFKYLGSPRTEVGVKVFGMAHGLIFIAFVVIAVLVGMAFKWRLSTWLLALLASIVPLASVIFLIWVDRTGRLGVRTEDAPAPSTSGTT